MPGEYILCDKAQNHSLFVTPLFLVLTFMSDIMFLNGFLIFVPIFNRQQCALLIDMSSERDCLGP